MKLFEFRRDVVERPDDWLPDLDAGLADIAGAEDRTKRYTNYNWRDPERLLSEASTFAEQCLSYRREYLDYAAAEIKRRDDLKLFCSLYESLLKLERADWLSSLQAQASERQNQVAERFRQDGQLGFADNAMAIAEALRAASEVDGERGGRKEQIESIWETNKRYQEDLDRRYLDQKSPLSLIRRAENARTFLNDNFGLAVAHARAAEIGLREVYSLDKKVLSFSVRPLDELVSWLRSVIADLEYIQNREIGIEVQIPVHSLMKGRLSDVLNSAQEESECTMAFILDAKRDADWVRRGDRLREVGLSLRFQDNNDSRASFFWMAAEVTPPLSGVPALLPLVTGLNVSTAPRFFGGPSIRNRLPVGEWRLVLGKLFHTGRTYAFKRSEIDGIWLHLRVVRDVGEFWGRETG